MMKGELMRHSRRQLNNVMTVSGDEQIRSVILMLKLFETETSACLERHEASLAKQQASLALHEDKLALVHKDVQAVLQLLQGVGKGKAGMNPVDEANPK